LLYAAYFRDQGKVTDAVFKAISKAEKTLKARLDLAA
jgi:hypothetical protein